MILFLYGEDTYRSIKKLTEIKDQFTQKHGVENLSVFDFSSDPSTALVDLSNFLNSPSIFAQSQMAVAQNPLSVIDKLSKKHLSKFTELIEKTSKDKYFWMVLWEGVEKNKLKKADSLIKIINKEAYTKPTEFTKAQGKTLVNQGQEFLNERNIKVSNQTLNSLANLSQNDTAYFFNALEVLSNYRAEDGVIEESDIAIITLPEKTELIFEILDSINQRRRSDLFYQLKKHSLLYNAEPLQLLGLVVSQLRKLLIAENLQDSKRVTTVLKSKPFAVNKLMSGLKNYKSGELKVIYSKVFELDRQCKIGEIEPHEILDLLPIIF